MIMDIPLKMSEGETINVASGNVSPMIHNAAPLPRVSRKSCEMMISLIENK